MLKSNSENNLDYSKIINILWLICKHMSNVMITKLQPIRITVKIMDILVTLITVLSGILNHLLCFTNE